MWKKTNHIERLRDFRNKYLCFANPVNLRMSRFPPKMGVKACGQETLFSVMTTVCISRDLGDPASTEVFGFTAFTLPLLHQFCYLLERLSFWKKGLKSSLSGRLPSKNSRLHLKMSTDFISTDHHIIQYYFQHHFMFAMMLKLLKTYLFYIVHSKK